jgi:hypothetical protein
MAYVVLEIRCIEGHMQTKHSCMDAILLLSVSRKHSSAKQPRDRSAGQAGRYQSYQHVPPLHSLLQPIARRPRLNHQVNKQFGSGFAKSELDDRTSASKQLRHRDNGTREKDGSSLRSPAQEREQSHLWLAACVAFQIASKVSRARRSLWNAVQSGADYFPAKRGRRSTHSLTPSQPETRKSNGH